MLVLCFKNFFTLHAKKNGKLKIYFNGNKAKDRMKFCNCSKKKKKCFKEVSNTVYVQNKK